MACVRCRRCGAVVTARGDAEAIETTYGASYRTKCKARAEISVADFVSKELDCPHIGLAIRQAAFRIEREAAALSE